MKIIAPRSVKLSTRTEIEVRRNLPHGELKRISAWVFMDHFGPTQMVDGMQVAAHPHTGLQTVTWPFSGAIEHNDSIGSRQVLHPGELNLMTAGHGIAHSERSISGAKLLHAVQLWLALPESVRDLPPTFEHHADLPVFNLDGLDIKLFIGSFAGRVSPATTHWPLVGAEVGIAAGQTSVLRLDQTWEHGILLVAGALAVDGEEVELNSLVHLPAGTEAARISASENSVIVLVGGAPFDEKIVLWWNFIARSNDEIVRMRSQWNGREPRFGEVEDSLGGWIPAPELPNLVLKPR
jgi:redox-sensitive bicupin YhaK (pirin superfamily)